MSESDRESDGAPCEVEYNEEQEGEEDADLEELPEGQRDIVDYYLEEPPVGDEYGDGVASEDEDDEEEFVPLNQLGALQTSSQVTHKSAPRCVAVSSGLAHGLPSAGGMLCCSVLRPPPFADEGSTGSAAGCARTVSRRHQLCAGPSSTACVNFSLTATAETTETALVPISNSPAC